MNLRLEPKMMFENRRGIATNIKGEPAPSVGRCAGSPTCVQSFDWLPEKRLTATVTSCSPSGPPSRPAVALTMCGPWR
ncbi:hypothetical protein C2E23DRAFT_810434 [Lenzites betulinus]|nr:hypothetical protein C2E23DRAFT_810434 [Lenzites betulinus]